MYFKCKQDDKMFYVMRNELNQRQVAFQTESNKNGAIKLLNRFEIVYVT